MINAFAASLAGLDVDADCGLSDAERIDRIAALENLKDAAAAAQAKSEVGLDASIRARRAAAGVPKERQGRGIAQQVGLARRESPHRAGLLLGVAKILVNEMPHTLRALETGVLNEFRAGILVRETACLTREDRAKVDEELAANPERLHGLGNRQLEAEAKRIAYRLDPRSVVGRAAKAEADRHVSSRPEPDTMVSVRTLLPVVQGVAVMAALNGEADRLRNAGDPRSRGQAMADTVFERLTGQSTADPARVEVQVVMTDRALLQGDSEPAWLTGYGIVPAQYARDLIRLPQDLPDPPKPTGSVARTTAFQGTAGPPGRRTADGLPGTVGGEQAQPAGTSLGWKTVRQETRRARLRALKVGGVEDIWVRRLYTAPGTGQLLRMDSKARKFPDGMRRMVMARDAVCTGSWCDAPIRHIDHIVAWSAGGKTTMANARGLCEDCNYAAEAEDWATRPVDGPGHSVETRTPTGHTQIYTPPPLPGTPTPAQPGSGRQEPAPMEQTADWAGEAVVADPRHVAGKGKTDMRLAQRRRRARLLRQPRTAQGQELD